jgi:hypothetical protein
MTPRFTAALVFVLGVGVLGIVGTINQFAIVEAVNAKLPPGDQFDTLGWWPSKTLRLHRQYRRLYPDGRLLWRQGVLASAMLFCMVLAGGLIGFGFLSMAFFGGIGALSFWFVYFKH